MPNAIHEDWADFKDITDGKRREELKKFIKNGSITGQRPTGKGTISIPIKKIELPYIAHGQPDSGVGSGEGPLGDVIGKKGEKGKKGNKPGTEPGEGMIVDIDMEDVWKELADEWKLPHLQPKDTPTYDELEIKYTGISRNGPRSLRHVRRTLKETLKREIAFNGGQLPKKMIPGCDQPVVVFHPTKDDFRYRQWREIKKPTSNAAIFFIRDGSGSMGDEKCEVVSDTAFWLNAWIKRSYKETKTFYIWHDTEARELSEKDFYHLRYGGGTYATSSLKFVEKQLNVRVQPSKWNIYLFYFGDGETFGQDSKDFVKMLSTSLSPATINLTGVAQIMCYSKQDALTKEINDALEKKKLDKKYVKTVSVGEEKHSLTPEERGEAVKHIITSWLGSEKQSVQEAAV